MGWLGCTMVQNNQESGPTYWARPFGHLLAALSLAHSTLVPSITCFTALTHSQACGKVNDKMSQNQAALNQSGGV